MAENAENKSIGHRGNAFLITELPPLNAEMSHLLVPTCLSFMAKFSISFFAWSNLLCEEINIKSHKIIK